MGELEFEQNGLSPSLHKVQDVGVSTEHDTYPVAGRDYPRTGRQFLSWFRDDDACMSYLEKFRWPRGFVCPHCGVPREPYRASRQRLVCRVCAAQSTVTAGTLFAGNGLSPSLHKEPQVVVASYGPLWVTRIAGFRTIAS